MVASSCCSWLSILVGYLLVFPLVTDDLLYLFLFYFFFILFFILLHLVKSLLFYSVLFFLSCFTKRRIVDEPAISVAGQLRRDPCPLREAVLRNLLSRPAISARSRSRCRPLRQILIHPSKLPSFSLLFLLLLPTPYCLYYYSLLLPTYPSTPLLPSPTSQPAFSHSRILAYMAATLRHSAAKRFTDRSAAITRRLH